MSYNKEALSALLGSLDDKQLALIFPTAIPNSQQATEGDDVPKPTGSKPSVDTADPKGKANNKEIKQAIDSASVSKIETAGDYLALYTRNYIQRDIKKERPHWIPDFRRSFHMLNLYDNQLSQNYYARRSLPAWFPTHSRIYIAILFHMATLRIQYSVHDITPENADLVERFFELFPPARLPIPGFLVPVFKSICSSAPEDSRYMRVTPNIPVDFITADDITTRFQDLNKVDDFRLPYVPYLFWLHHQLMKDNHDAGATPTYGAADSAGAGNRTVTVPVSTTSPHVISLLMSPKQQQRRLFPFAGAYPAAVANGANAAWSHSIFGTDSTNTLFADLPSKWPFAKCGLAEPINVHRDLITQFIQNSNLIEIPEVDVTDTFDTMASMLGFETDYDWFGQLIESMETYCAYTKGTATLEDCSIEGPPTGQYLVNIPAPTTLPTAPVYFGDQKASPCQGGKLSTTRKTEEPLVEALCHHTQVHTRWYGTHPAWPNLGSGTSRTAPFWSIRPLFTSGTTDTGYALLNSEIKKSILGKLKD